LDWGLGGLFGPSLIFKGVSSSKDAYISKDFGVETTFLKRTSSMNFQLDCIPKELLQDTIKLGLTGVFPNITIALHIFVTLPASVALGECTFNVLKKVKNYYCSTMGQDH
jgi:hypothetical protein